MPEAIIQSPVLFWDCRTREGLDDCAWDIHDNLAGHTAHTLRTFDEAAFPTPYVEVMMGGGGVVAKVELGQVLLRNGVWEVLSEAEAIGRGLPIDPTPDS